ncbi:Phosphotransferase enzyme family protein [Pseudooceanicola antarcticus]|uniref:Aminoglycoside phosphotransferase n=1 Tax=Pseudooceanicola antarcticus TaxID=1247613 RepID=A0A285HYG7_9RHOB|nr:phosphotransferase [Pseudooceanicola antarcticus]PJE27419.1 aminoglycoside phosphotransferase [Pseudooceanicola antarcticus]SNY39836.1 Phosphotransferase enzyme family protein [Pseudooceanicola antarcticus]
MAVEQAEPLALTHRLAREISAALARQALACAPDPAPPALWQALGGGRSNLCWRIPAPDGDLVLKLYRVQNAGPVFPNDPEAEAACLLHLQDQALAPQLLAHWQGAEGPCLLYRHLPGPLWQSDVTQVARLLRRLHRVPVPKALHGLRRGPDGSAALRQEIRAQARGVAGEEADDWPEKLMQELPAAEIPPLQKTCLIHGDPVPGNLVAGPEGLRLIDWQCPALGDPCVDLATFLSPAMQYLYRGEPLSAPERTEFLAAYDDPLVTRRLEALWPFLSARIIAHCQSRAARGSAADARAAELERHGG